MHEKSPDAYRSISEAGEEASLPPHVLRFWESRFTQLKPIKRNTGRRMYRPQDILLIKGLRRLLYEDGYTIKGAQKYLKEHGVAAVAALAGADAPAQLPRTEQQTGFSTLDKADLAVSDPGHATLAQSERAVVGHVCARLDAARQRLQGVLGQAG